MLKKIVALYSLLTGVSMAAVWTIYFFTGTVFGVEPPASGLCFHIAAEFVTAAFLTFAGIAFFAGSKYARHTFFAGIGMLIYAVVNSPGMYAGGPHYGFMLSVFFSSFIFAALFFVLALFIKD